LPPVPGPVSISQYFGGFWEIATDGIGADNVKLGQLFFRYRVKYKKANVDNNGELGDNTVMAHYEEFPDKTATDSLPFGTTGFTLGNVGNTLDSVQGVNAYQMLFSQTGIYKVDFIWSGSTATITSAPTVTLGGNLTALTSYFSDNTSAAINTFATSKSIRITVIQVAKNGTDSSNYFSVTSAGTSMAAAYCDVFVTLMPRTITLKVQESVRRREERKQATRDLLDLIREREVEEEKEPIIIDQLTPLQNPPRRFGILSNLVGVSAA